MLADEHRLGQERLRGELLGGLRMFGDTIVRSQTIAFRKFKLFTQELIGQTMLELPAQQIDTVGLWLQPPKPAIEAVHAGGFKSHEALSGARNLLTVALPTLAMCDRYDIGGVVNSSQLGAPTIILYDRYQGGVGYARHGFERAEELLTLACSIAETCDCDVGCPGCVGPPNLRVAIHQDPDLGGGYAIPDKRATLLLLRSWSTGASDGRIVRRSAPLDM